jgi:hypothetical protein
MKKKKASQVLRGSMNVQYLLHCLRTDLLPVPYTLFSSLKPMIASIFKTSLSREPMAMDTLTRVPAYEEHGQR